MQSIRRRNFLAWSLGGLAAASLSPSLLAQEAIQAKKAEAVPPPVSNDPFASLFLTWQQDPTTTMTIQWVGKQSAADVRVAPLSGGEWRTAKTNTKPYTNTDLLV